MVAVNISVVLVAPGISANGPPLLTCHCTDDEPLVAAVNVAVSPSQTVASTGLVVTVGAVFTVSVAAVVVAVPAALVNTARYWLPLSAAVAVNMSVVLVAPEIGANDPPPLVLTSHCTVGAGLPLLEAVKVAVPPSQTVWSVGLVITLGASAIVIEAVTVW